MAVIRASVFGVFWKNSLLSDGNGRPLLFLSRETALLFFCTQEMRNLCNVVGINIAELKVQNVEVNVNYE